MRLLSSSKKIKIIAVLFVAICFLSLCVITVSYAQQVRTMTIVPPTVEQTLNPGDKAEGTMKVINNSNEPISIKVETQDFIVNDTQGTPQLLPPNTLSGKYSASSWIGISPDSFTIPAHDKQLLNYFVQIPNTAGAGGHYAAVVFQPGNNGSLQSSGATIQTEVGTLFYIKVTGTINEFAQVNFLRTNHFQEYGPITIVSEVKNLGDLHITPKGEIKISDMLGNEIAVLPLDTHNIFPGASRDYTNRLNQQYLLGYFKVSLNGSYGINHNLPLRAYTYFWVFPWKIALILLLVVIACVLGIFTLRAKSKTRDLPTEYKDSTQ